LFQLYRLKNKFLD